MIPSKAYILYIDTPTSIEYMQTCVESCDRVGLSYELVKGISNMNPRQSWDSTGINYKGDLSKYDHVIDKPTCCSAGHAMIWKMIADREECAIVLEHDAIMLHPVNVDIPENRIVNLGYKLKNIQRYDYETAGPPTRVIDVEGHEGCHAYALTPNTARSLVDEIEERGVLGCVDNAYFIYGQRRTRVPLAMVTPTAAIAWLRKSTLWSESAEVNFRPIESFTNHLR